MICGIKSILIKTYIRLKEKTYQGRLRYLYQKNLSDVLIVVFSGFSEKPMYNYVRTLQSIKADKIFILDDFGYKGSYYWYENGCNKPMELVKSFLSSKLGAYKNLITLGSSKGGTCAIYYGLLFGASDIYSGACQYYVGKYLNRADHIDIFKSMMGDEASSKEESILDTEMSKMLRKHKGSNTRIHLFYSKDEHTYEDDIKHLINDLEDNDIAYDEKIESFAEHSLVGKYFSPWVRNQLKEKINNG